MDNGDRTTREPLDLPVLTTDRLRLRPFRPDDVSWAYHVSLDPEFTRWLDIPDPLLPAHTVRFVEELAIGGARAGLHAEFVVEDPATRIALGRVALHLRDGGEAELGYWLAAAARGRGYMTEAAAEACRWGFADAPRGLGLRRIVWHAFHGNHGSRRVAERLGFTVPDATAERRGRTVWTGALHPADLRPPPPAAPRNPHR